MSRRRKNLLSSDKSGPDVLEDPTQSRVHGEKRNKKKKEKEEREEKRRSKSVYVERGWWVEGGG